MLKELFEKVFNFYLEDKAAYYSVPPPRSFENLPSAITLAKQLPEKLRMACSLNKGYEITGSIGRPQIPEVPHVCVLDTDITDSPTRGYYAVYLFDSTLSRVYLSLNQGWTQYEQVFDKKTARKEIWNNTTKARRLLRSKQGFSIAPINLNAQGRLGRGYELGNICSVVYEKDNLPDDAILIDDLRNLLGVYRELKGLVGVSILEIDNKADNEYHKYKSDLSDLPNTGWVVNESQAPPTITESLDEVLATPELLRYSQEPDKSYLVNSVSNSVTRSRKHGILANVLADELQARGFKVFNDRFRDLIAKNSNGDTKLFEIKTTSSTHDIYKAIGQLFVYSIGFTEIAKAIDLILVLPENRFLGKLKDGLQARGIKVLYYEWKNGSPIFTNWNE